MDLARDFRLAVRSLLREPAFAAISILTLAAGIGGNTAIFSIVNGVLLKPLEYRDPERLVYPREVLMSVADQYPTLPVAARHFLEWRDRCSSFENLALIEVIEANLAAGGEAERIDVARVSANFFETLGVAPALGRGFAEGEDTAGRDDVAIISDALWRRRFGADPSIVGRKVTLDAVPVTIVGVLPPGFRYPSVGYPFASQASPLQPALYRPRVIAPHEYNQLIGPFNYNVIGRLKPGVSPEQAQAELNVVAKQLVKLSGQEVDLRAAVFPLGDAITGRSRRGLVVLLGAVGSVLLIACLNLASLGLARAERRSGEAAIRTALGASRARLVRSALIESLIVASAGGLLGVGVAAVSLGALLQTAPRDLPRVDSVSLDAPVLLFALALTAVTALLVGVVPAWRAAREDPQNALRAGGRTASGAAGGARLRSALVAGEACIGMVLLVTAAVMAASFMRLMSADKGFEAPSVLSTKISMPSAKYSTREQRNAFHARLLATLAGQPGVLSAAITTALPLEGETWVDSIGLPGAPQTARRPNVNVRFVSSEYLRTMGIPLRAGRTFAESDRGRQVVIISQQLAEAFWPGRDAVGRTLERNPGDTYEVIGVAGDVRAEAHQPPVAMLYRPYWEWAPRTVSVVARSSGDPRAVAGALREAVRVTDPEVALAPMRTVREILEGSVETRRFQMRLAAVFAGTALLLAALGIYGVVSHGVARRRNEVGIRMALGASPASVIGMVIRQGMMPVVAGIAAGAAGSLAAARVLESLLYEVSPRDPAIIAAVALALGLTAAAACYIPARRAAQVDPLEALRYE
jgi:predicted permease